MIEDVMTVASEQETRCIPSLILHADVDSVDDYAVTVRLVGLTAP